MKQYRDIRAKAGILEICKRPDLAAQVTLQPVEVLDVDAAIIFADLLLPVEPMGLRLKYVANEGPQIGNPVRTSDDVDSLSISNTDELGYVGEAIQLVVRQLAGRVPVIGFVGAPFTLASYMIEGGGSRNYVEVKKMMYNQPQVWDELNRKLVDILAAYSLEQIKAGADVHQVFDSWVGCLSVEDYRRYVLPHTTELVQRLKASGAPIIYFGTDSSTLLTSMQETGADVIGLDWRIPLDEGWRKMNYQPAVQGNLDPVTLFANWEEIEVKAEEILRQANGRPGHIFNLGHGILPQTPVDNVKRLAKYVRERSGELRAQAVR